MDRKTVIFFNLLFVLSFVGLLFQPLFLQDATSIPHFEKIVSNEMVTKNLPYRATIQAELSITILSDVDFSSYSFPGDGSASNPFRIEDETYPSIKISNISKYVIIRNCTLTYVDRPISISLTAPDSITIINNTLIFSTNPYEGSNIGISVHYSDGIIIKDNIVGGYAWAIHFNGSPNCLIDNNTIFNSAIAGLCIEFNSPYATISNNTIFDCKKAMRFDDSNFLLIENNHCFNNTMGIVMTSFSDCYSSGYCTIRYNLLENHQSYGILISGFYDQDFCTNNLIYLNTFLDNNPNGTSQAKDVSSDNMWYNSDTRQGNFWSDWFGVGNYKIDGEAQAIDKHPLNTAFHDIDFPSFNFIAGKLIVVSIVFGLLLIIIGIVVIIQRKKNKGESHTLLEQKNESAELVEEE